jgi:cytochrome c-type biogenesis protein CcsB
MVSLVLVLALCAYVVATVLFGAHLASRSTRLAGLGLRALVVGIALHVAGKAAQFMALGTLPVVDGKAALGALALVVAVLFVWAAWRYRVPTLGAFATPLVVVTLAASLAFSSDDGVVPAALRSAWFPVHIVLAISADACFAIAGVIGVAFLVQDDRLRRKRPGPAFKLLPPLHVLEEIGHRFVMTGFLLMTLAIVAGSLFAKEMWGAYWSWDPKQCFTLTTWLLFAGILHARITVGWRGRRAAWLTVTGAALLVVAMVGLNALVRTRHGGSFDGQKNQPTLTSRPTVPGAATSPEGGAR